MFVRVAVFLFAAILIAGCEGHRWYSGHRELPFAKVVSPNPENPPEDNRCRENHDNPASQTSGDSMGADEAAADTPCSSDGSGPVALAPAGEPTQPETASPGEDLPPPESRGSSVVPIVAYPDSPEPEAPTAGSDDGDFVIPTRKDDPNRPQVKVNRSGLTRKQMLSDAARWVNNPMQEMSAAGCSFTTEGEGEAETVTDFNCDDNGRAQEQVGKIADFLAQSDQFYKKYVRAQVVNEELAKEVDQLLANLLNMQRTARVERERLRMFFNIRV